MGLTEVKNSFRAILESIIPLSDNSWQYIDNCLVVKKYKKDQLYTGDDHQFKGMQFVIRGLIRSYFIRNGEEVTWGFFLDEDIAVDFPSFLSGASSRLHYEMLEDTHCIYISKEHIEAFYKHLPESNKIGRILTEEGFLKHHKRSQSLLLDAPEQRYLELINTKPEILQRVPQKHIATYIGVKPESLSRIKKRIFSGVS